MILGAHVIFGAYGFWLPNDPRGSWSDFVGSYELYRYGGATKTTERRSLAYRRHDRQLRLTAKSALQRPTVQFDDAQINAIAVGFGRYVQKSGLPVWSCAIQRDHAHLVIGSTPMNVESRVVQLKANATWELIRQGIHPFQNECDEDRKPPKCFARGEWKVFLNTPADVVRAADYSDANPEKDGLPRQCWAFVSPLPVWTPRSASRRG